VRAAHRPLLLPLPRIVEATDAPEQAVRGGVEMRGGAGDLVGQRGWIIREDRVNMVKAMRVFSAWFNRRSRVCAEIVALYYRSWV
jgi:hypothetical protein